ncbi:MAG: hypothetical protein WCK35_23235 [Chloroflexota bacterium]
MNINRKLAIKENKMKITSSKVIRWAGLAPIGAGIIYISIQPFHPLDIFSSVTTAQWAIVHYLSIVMDMLGMLGLAAIFARQVEKSGRLGLVGYLQFSLFWALSMAFHFIEAFIEPVLANVAPKFVEGLLGMITSAPSAINLGALPTVYQLAGLIGYVLGGLLFGIATFRAGVLPRWAGALLAVGTILPVVLSSVVHHPYDRLFAVPVVLALIWLGISLFSEWRAPASEPVLVKGSPLPSQTGAD